MSMKDDQEAMAAMVHGVARARSLGVADSEWLCEVSDHLSFSWSGDQVTDVQRSVEKVVRVRVWLEGGQAGQSEGSLGALESVLDKALVRAKKGQVDLNDRPVRSMPHHLEPLSTEDRRYQGLSVDDRVEVVAGAYRALKKLNPELQADVMTWSDVRVQRFFVNSRGVRFTEKETTYQAHVEVTYGVPEGAIVASRTPSSRRFSVLAAVPYAVRAGQQLLQVEGAPVALSGPIRVMLGSAATAKLFDAIAQGFWDGQVPGFLLGRDGQPRAFDRRLNLRDDGRTVGGLRSRSFDDRGVVPKPVMLIRDGRLGGRLVSLKEARKENIEPTGHQSGAGLRPSNLTLMAGTRSLNAIAIARGGPSIWVNDLPDLSSGGLDLVTGQLDCVVHGRVMEGNQVQGVARGVRLTGDLGTALEQVVEISSDTDRVGHIDAPGMVFDGLEVRGSG